jgi:hypothetical protein
MADDERKSRNSQYSSSSLYSKNVEEENNIALEKFFNLIYPLYAPEKRPDKLIPVMFWALHCAQVVALAFFQIDKGTGA